MEINQLTEEQLINNAYLKLWDRSKVYLPESSEQNLFKAFQFAKKAHSEQRRKSGEPYILHPLAVAEILTEYHMDETSLIAAILHDVVEDTDHTFQEIETEFGKSVSVLVDGLTKLSKIKFRSSQEKMAENFRKMVLAMSKDIRVLIVKLADRTHNMRTIRALPMAKRRSIAEETIEIHAPLSGRLGMHKIKAELEDLSFRELKPTVYYSLISKIKQKRLEREVVIQNTTAQLNEKLKEEQISSHVYGRAKHFYSIYKKITEKQMEFQDVYDLLALRVIVKSVAECYEVLGVIHNLYTPVPGRFKDYIALPKANLYQSLHTTVVVARSELLEIQIRTEQMHDIAENGIAAHWLYKKMREKGPDGSRSLSAEMEKFTWIKQILSHEKEISDPNEFLETVKVDLFDDEVYVFSPKGDVYALKKGATGLDFAFAVHTDLGLKTAGVKVNGRIASLRGRVFSGDVIEVISSNKFRATKDWLNFVQTSKARSRIRAYLASLIRETEIQAPEVAQLVKQPQRRRAILPPGQNPEDIISVQGMTGIVLRRAKCCAPLPDQPIIGFVARAGKGIMVHASNCHWAFLNNPGRRVECSWNNKTPQGHEVKLKILALDKMGVLAGVTKAVTALNMNISTIDCLTTAQKRAMILLKLELQTLEALNSVHQSIEAVDGVISVERI